MAEEPNQARDIYSCLAWHGPLEAEEIVQRTQWHRYVVDTALGLMEEQALIQKVGTAPSGEPTYDTALNVVLKAMQPPVEGK